MKNFLLHFQVLTHKKKLSTYYEKKNLKMFTFKMSLKHSLKIAPHLVIINLRIYGKHFKSQRNLSRDITTEKKKNKINILPKIVVP